MGNVYSVKSNDKVLNDLISNMYLEEKSIFAITLSCESCPDRTCRIETRCKVATDSLIPPIPHKPHLTKVYVDVGALQMELIFKCMYTGQAHCDALCETPAKRALYTAESSMFRGFRDDMELYQTYGPLFGTWEGNQSPYEAFKSQSSWSSNVATEGRGNYYYDITDPNYTRFDVNNNNNDAYPATCKQEISSAMLYRNQNFEPKGNVTDHLYVQIGTPDPFVPLSNNVLEQTEPIDLSFEKKRKLKEIETPHYQVKTKYFKPNPIPWPSDISEASMIILKSMYNAQYHRKPNCDLIFWEDPADPKLHICQMCTKRVRSKWHHFQTHFSRDHKCSDCDAVYSRIDTLRLHAKKRHHTTIPRYYNGIPATVWHRVFALQCCPDPPERPPTPRPEDAGSQEQKRHRPN